MNVLMSIIFLLKKLKQQRELEFFSFNIPCLIAKKKHGLFLQTLFQLLLADPPVGAKQKFFNFHIFENNSE